MYQTCCKTAIRQNSFPERVGPDGAKKCPVCNRDLRRIRFATQVVIGDIVRMDVESDRGYGDMTVYQITDKDVHLYRPYVVTSDFITSGGAIPYIGIEDFSIARSDHHTLILLRRQPVEDGGLKKD